MFGQMFLWSNVKIVKCLFGQILNGKICVWPNVCMVICLLGQMFFWPNFVWSNVHMVNLFGYILHGQMFLGSNWVKETSNQPCFRLTGFLLNSLLQCIFSTPHGNTKISSCLCIGKIYFTYV